jgi:hypothetical protein
MRKTLGIAVLGVLLLSGGGTASAGSARFPNELVGAWCPEERGDNCNEFQSLVIAATTYNGWGDWTQNEPQGADPWGCTLRSISPDVWHLKFDLRDVVPIPPAVAAGAGVGHD